MPLKLFAGIADVVIAGSLSATIDTGSSFTGCVGAGACRRRYSRRHLNTMLLFNPWRRATPDTDAPGTSVSSTT